MDSLEFLHGIDEVGQAGFAPLLCVGGKIAEADFSIRDLSSITGVIISERGLPAETEWDDLNLWLLGERLRNLRYLWIEFSKKVDLNHFGVQKSMSSVKLYCPKLRRIEEGLFPNLVDVELTIPDSEICSLLPDTVKTATLIRPKFQDLSQVSNCRSLETLDIHYARNLVSLKGLSGLSALKWVGLHDCPTLQNCGASNLEPGPVELMFGGCKRLTSLEGLENMKNLKVVSVLGPGPNLLVPPELRVHGVELNIKGRGCT